MPAFLLALGPFLKTWWKVILPVVLLLMALGYVKVLHMEIDHYKAQNVELRLAIKQSEDRKKLLEDNATALNKKYETQLYAKQLEETKKQKLVKERIKRDKESKLIVLPATSVELFNASKPDVSESTPRAEQGDDGKASADPAVVTLNKLLEVSAINDEHHQQCINQVLEWQNFWTDYKASVQSVGGT